MKRLKVKDFTVLGLEMASFVAKRLGVNLTVGRLDYMAKNINREYDFPRGYGYRCFAEVNVRAIECYLRDALNARIV